MKKLLIIDIKVKLILNIFFFMFYNTNILFDNKIFIQEFYTTNKALIITK